MAEHGADRSTTLFRGSFLELAKIGTWEFVQRVQTTGESGGPAVGIVAMTDDGAIVLISQYRVPVQKICIEIPAGLVGDKGEREEWEAAARRELLEETGFTAECMEVLMEGPTNPGLTSECMKIVRARGIRKVGPPTPDAGEDITVHEVPLGEIQAFLDKKVAAGALVDPKVYAALYFLQLP